MTTATTEDELLAERRGPVLLAALNRPAARNALTMTLVGELGAALLEAENDPWIRAVVLTAAGDRAFCVGMDLTAFSDGMTFEPTEQHQAGYAAFDRFMRGEITVPVIGAAGGTAVGGGFELLLACDLVVVSDQGRYGLPEVRRGLISGGGGGVLLGSRLPVALALELVLTGDLVDGARAKALGLVNRVVPPDQVLDVALALAARITANAPLAVAVSKQIVRLAAADPPAAFTRLAELRGSVFASEDAKEGAAAYLAKREPVWTGR
ncbi:Enoyl-CoA hydratase [Frankia sp. AiPs1]|uniref:enoyl-CoA hydratase-related protein n=1 Tax=Frankia sp. AiPa1 TaxID=573492 RepID=UPI00202B575A|nr:enoyl-CoA hydratase-related protein [Frankia sp. AiPa1]MCL9762308.1 enoyl-CoA hydratase-related protein [Frankia sp. AiPa1]